MKVFVTTFFYALAKVAAHQDIDPYKAVDAALRTGTWEAGRSIRALQEAIMAIPGASSQLLVNSNTSIARGRSMAAHAFAHGDADVWVSVDDDALVDQATMAVLLQAVHDAREPRIVMVPQVQVRDASDPGPRVNVRFLSAETPQVSRVVAGKRLVRVDYAGCSVMAMNRVAIARLRVWYPELDCTTQETLGLFAEKVRLLADGPTWIGEDVAFCELARRAEIDVEALADVPSVHGKQGLAAEWLETFLTPETKR